VLAAASPSRVRTAPAVIACAAVSAVILSQAEVLDERRRAVRRQACPLANPEAAWIKLS
jgi:hypothetical protein